MFIRSWVKSKTWIQSIFGLTQVANWRKLVPSTMINIQSLMVGVPAILLSHHVCWAVGTILLSTKRIQSEFVWDYNCNPLLLSRKWLLQLSCLLPVLTFFSFPLPNSSLSFRGEMVSAFLRAKHSRYFFHYQQNEQTRIYIHLHSSEKWQGSE